MRRRCRGSVRRPERVSPMEPIRKHVPGSCERCGSTNTELVQVKWNGESAKEMRKCRECGFEYAVWK